MKLLIHPLLTKIRHLVTWPSLFSNKKVSKRPHIMFFLRISVFLHMFLFIRCTCMYWKWHPITNISSELWRGGLKHANLIIYATDKILSYDARMSVVDYEKSIYFEGMIILQKTLPSYFVDCAVYHKRYDSHKVCLAHIIFIMPFEPSHGLVLLKSCILLSKTAHI